MNIDEQVIYNIVEKAKKYDELLKLQKRMELHCSFCGKSESAVSKLIAGIGIFICNECVGLCLDIIEDEDGKVMKEYYKVCSREMRQKELLDDLGNFKYTFGQGTEFKTYDKAKEIAEDNEGVVVKVREEVALGKFDPHAE